MQCFDQVPRRGHKDLKRKKLWKRESSSFFLFSVKVFWAADERGMGGENGEEEEKEKGKRWSRRNPQFTNNGEEDRGAEIEGRKGTDRDRYL